MQKEKLETMNAVQKFQYINTIIDILKKEVISQPELLKRLRSQSSLLYDYGKDWLDSHDDYKSNQDFIEDLQGFKDDTVSDIDAYLSDSLYNFGGIDEAIHLLYDYFGNYFDDYLDQHHILFAYDIGFMNKLKQRLADSIVRMDRNNLDMGYIERLSNILYDIRNDRIQLIDRDAMSSLDESDIEDIGKGLEATYLN